MISKWLAEAEDDDPLVEESILECLFIGGRGMGLDIVLVKVKSEIIH